MRDCKLCKKSLFRIGKGFFGKENGPDPEVSRFQFQKEQFKQGRRKRAAAGCSSFNSRRNNSNLPQGAFHIIKEGFQFQKEQFKHEVSGCQKGKMQCFNSRRNNSNAVCLRLYWAIKRVSIPEGTIQTSLSDFAEREWAEFQFQKEQFKPITAMNDANKEWSFNSRRELKQAIRRRHGKRYQALIEPGE